MITLKQDIPCDLSMGFSLDMLLDLINSSCDEIIIDIRSAHTISHSHSYVFQTYFLSDDDRVAIQPAHDIKVVDGQQFKAIAWGTATLLDGTASFVLQLSHHFQIDYIMRDSSCGNAKIHLDYNGTEVSVIEGGNMDVIPNRLIRQAVQTHIKKNGAMSIQLPPPSINIPFADSALDVQRLTFNPAGEETKKDDLIFLEVSIDGNSHTFGGFAAYGKTAIDINHSCLLRKGDEPLHITARGIHLLNNTTTVNVIGSSSATHSILPQSPSSYSLHAALSDTESQFFQDMVDTNVGYAYNPIYAVINPVLEHFGQGLETVKDVKSLIFRKALPHISQSRPGFTLEYSIRKVEPADISIDILDASLDPNTNSFVIKLHYTFSGMDENTADSTSDAGFVYPYGLGVMVGERLIKKIFKTYWDSSHVLPKRFSSSCEMLIHAENYDAAGFYSLNFNTAELQIDPNQTAISTTIDAINNKAKLAAGTASGTNPSSINGNEHDSHQKPVGAAEKASTAADIALCDGNRLDITLQDTSFENSSVHNNAAGIFTGTRIELLHLPETLTFNHCSLPLSYNYVNVNTTEVVIGSKIAGLKKRESGAHQPSLPSAKRRNPTLIVPRNRIGHEGAADGCFDIPCGLAIQKTEISCCLYVADRNNNRIQMFDKDGVFVMQWGSKGSEEGEFDSPTGISVDANGYLFVVDTGNNRVQKFAPDGSFIMAFGENGKGEGKFSFPQGIATDDKGSVYVTDSNHLIQKFDSTCKFVKQWGGKGTKRGKFFSPRGIATREGELYVADAGNHRIQRFNLRGKCIAVWGERGSENGQFCYPQGLALDESGNLFVADTGNNRIQKFDNEGNFIAKASREGALLGQLLAPMGIAVTSGGDIYTADSLNSRVQIFGGNY